MEVKSVGLDLVLSGLDFGVVSSGFDSVQSFGFQSVLCRFFQGVLAKLADKREMLETMTMFC